MIRKLLSSATKVSLLYNKKAFNAFFHRPVVTHTVLYSHMTQQGNDSTLS